MKTDMDLLKMQLNKIYLIRTGHFHKQNGDTQIDWYDKDLLQFPVFTTFEEADLACRCDWNNLMYENWDNYAKICEHTMTTWGTWYISHEWIYCTDEDFQIETPLPKEKGVYKLFQEKEISQEGVILKEIVYKEI